MCRRATTKWMDRSARTDRKQPCRTRHGSASPTWSSSSSESSGDGRSPVGAADLSRGPGGADRSLRMDRLRVGEQEVRGAMATVSVLRAAGATDAGRQREVNEDRFHVDGPRRLFMVVDGIGGQAAGGKAADTAVSMLRSRLARGRGPAVEGV